MTIKASNYPTIRPTLNLDFAKSKQLDPRITFSRASSATYVDANGLVQSAASGAARFDHNPTTGESLGLLVEESRTNYLNSRFFNTSPWLSNNLIVRENAAMAPDGTFTAASLVATAVTDSHRLFMPSSSPSTPLDSQFVFTGFFKYNGHRYVSYNCNINAGTYGHFDLLLGVAGYGSITDVGNGWYKCQSAVYPAAWNNSNNTLSIALTTSSTAGSQTGFAFLGDGISGVYAWGLQSEAGSFPTSYIPTPATFTSRASTATYYNASGVIQTAAINTARSSAYFPDSSGVMRPAGLLLEAAATNLVRYSDFSNSLQWWSEQGATRTIESSVTAPNGTTSGVIKVQAVAGGGVHGLNHDKDFLGSVIDGTASVYVKKGTHRYVGIEKYSVHAGYPVCRFDFDTETIVGNASVQKLPNGWYRISGYSSSWGSPGPSHYALTLFENLSNSLGWTATGTETAYFWGPQLETGSYPTSYIPTVASAVTRSADVSSSATVTRSADVAQITGTNFSSWYNQSQGTWFASFANDAVKQGAFRGILSLGPNNIPRLLGNSVVGYNGSLSYTPSALTKVSLAYGTTEGRAANGIITSGAGGTIDIESYVSIGTGASSDPPSYMLSTSISRLTYYPTRLSDATLQTITQ